jgi:MFS family permease
LGEPTITFPVSAATPAASPRRDTWISFAYFATWAFMLYAIGIATPYLKVDLRLTDFQAGLHGSAFAVGILVAGAIADRLARWLGPNWLPDMGVAVLLIGIALIAFAPALPVSLAGAMLVGLGGATVATDVNVRLSRVGGDGARRLFSQANALAMLMAAAAPVAIGLAAAGLHAWRLGLAIPVVGFLALTVVRPREKEERMSVRVPSSRLPRAYWFSWAGLVVAVAIEFSFVYWGSTMIARQTNISSSDATLLASLFVVGMFLCRAALGTGFGGGRTPRLVMATGLLVVIAGACLVLVSPVPILSGVGLLLGGLGTAALFPVGLSVALQSAPNAQFAAAARVTLASGVAVLLAPSALGLAADAVGVAGAWTMIPGLAVAGLIVLGVTPRSS